jgi:hypothetical protein
MKRLSVRVKREAGVKDVLKELTGYTSGENMLLMNSTGNGRNDHLISGSITGPILTCYG